VAFSFPIILNCGGAIDRFNEKQLNDVKVSIKIFLQEQKQKLN
jgi:hypothetical protein